MNKVFKDFSCKENKIYLRYDFILNIENVDGKLLLL